MKANGGMDCPIIKNLKKDKKGNITDVEYEYCIFCGGEGIDYEYVDPETKEKSIRKLAVVVDTEKQFNGTGVKYVALADIYLRGAEGFSNLADMQECKIVNEANKPVGKKHKHSNKKETIDIEPKFGLPSYYAPQGKLIVSFGGQGLNLAPGSITIGEGADIIGEGPIVNNPIVGEKVKLIKNGHKSKEKERTQIAPSMAINNLGNQKVRFSAVDKDGKRFDIDLTGLLYSGKNGTLQLKGHNAILARQITTITRTPLHLSQKYHLNLLNCLRPLALNVNPKIAHIKL